MQLDKKELKNFITFKELCAWSGLIHNAKNFWFLKTFKW